MELFLYGNPRILAGGAGLLGSSRSSYESTEQTTASNEKPHTSELVNNLTGKITPGSTNLFSKLVSLGEVIHRGKSGYHPDLQYNNFLVEGQDPSAGIELETVVTRGSREDLDALVNDLRSNWFHFERDGSLNPEDGGTYGFELVTEPLPPRIYRDARTWIGLSNVISPWLESFDHPETGLHVHVGVAHFSKFDTIPIKNHESRILIGKIMSVLTYYALADAAFIDRVVLRRNTSYCSAPSDLNIFNNLSALSTGTMTGYDFMDMVVEKIIQANAGSWRNGVADIDEIIRRSTPDGQMRPLQLGDRQFCRRNPFGSLVGHNTEVNISHRATIEFRRSKGTIHPLSIHRIVELMTLIVRYATKCVRSPQETVSPQKFYEFVYNNTTSTALKNLTKQML